MFGSGHLISGLDVATGTFALMIFSAGGGRRGGGRRGRLVAATRRHGAACGGVLWVGALALVGGMLAYALVRSLQTRAGRRTPRDRGAGGGIDGARARAGLGARLPRCGGQALVENACEKPLFASPRRSLRRWPMSTPGFRCWRRAALAERDPSYRPSYERLRRGLEADRYGLVAHVLTTRGCDGADCPEITLAARSRARRRQHEGACLRGCARRACVGLATERRRPAMASRVAVGTVRRRTAQ